jgi:DNA-binding NtrC family response regulator
MGTNKPKIMVVDDELGFRDLAVRVFRDNYLVETAADGEEALGKAAAGGIEVVVSDIAMPKMSGIELMGALKKYDPKIEVILITGFSGFESEEECIRLGAFAQLNKPFDINELAETVARAVRKRRLAPGAEGGPL